MNKHTSLTPLLVGLAVIALTASLSQADVLFNFKLEFDAEPISLALDCPEADPAAVDVDYELFGTLHVVVAFTEDGKGRFHVHVLAHPEDMFALGLTTGTIYRAAGKLIESDFILPSGDLKTFTVLNDFLFIGPGPGNNYVQHLLMHLAFDANGTLTAEVEGGCIECFK